MSDILVAEFDGGRIELPMSPYALEYEAFVDDFRVKEHEWIQEQLKWTKTPYDQQIKDEVDVMKKRELEKKRDSYELTKEQIEGLEKSRILLIDALSSVIVGDFDKIPFRPYEKVPKGFMYHPDELSELSVIHIYKHVVNMIENYRPVVVPDEPVFTIAGEGYYFAKDSIVTHGTGFTVGEAVTVLELRNEASRYEQIKGYDGNMDFSLSMKELAVMCRLKGEKLPFNKALRHLWMNDRIELFHKANLSYGNVIDVKFFFLHFIKDLSPVDFTNGTSSRHLRMRKATVKTGHRLN